MKQKLFKNRVANDIIHAYCGFFQRPVNFSKCDSF